MRNQRIRENLEKISSKIKGIEVDDAKMGGTPVIRETRIPVSLVIACLRDKMSLDEICEEYGLQYGNVVDALDYVIGVLDSSYKDIGEHKE